VIHTVHDQVAARPAVRSCPAARSVWRASNQDRPRSDHAPRSDRSRPPAPWSRRTDRRWTLVLPWRNANARWSRPARFERFGLDETGPLAHQAVVELEGGRAFSAPIWGLGHRRQLLLVQVNQAKGISWRLGDPLARPLKRTCLTGLRARKESSLPPSRLTGRRFRRRSKTIFFEFGQAPLEEIDVRAPGAPPAAAFFVWTCGPRTRSPSRLPKIGGAPEWARW